MSKGISLKTKEDIANLKVSSKVLADTLRLLVSSTRAGLTTNELDDIAYDYIMSQAGCEPAFLNYQPYGADYPFPATMCISVNEAIVHGIPDNYVLKEGDIVSYDGGVIYKRMISDAAVSVIVTDTGCISIKDILIKYESGDVTSLSDKEKLLYVTYKSMLAGIKEAKIGNHINQISKSIEKSILDIGKSHSVKYGIVKIFAGHGVGHKVHEEPYVPNYDDGVKGPQIRDGLVLAIEPMVTMGTDEVDFMDDGYTAVTADTSLAAHFEHTVLAGVDGGEILTD